MGEKYRDAIGHGHRHARAALGADVPIRFGPTQKSLPVAAMAQDGASVYLIRGGEPGRRTAKQGTKPAPPGGDVAHRLRGLHAEAAARPPRGECGDTELGEVVDDLSAFPNVHRRAGADRAHRVRRSSTRSTLAPSARRRSSMRS